MVLFDILGLHIEHDQRLSTHIKTSLNHLNSFYTQNGCFSIKHKEASIVINISLFFRYKPIDQIDKAYHATLSYHVLRLKYLDA